MFDSRLERSCAVFQKYATLGEYTRGCCSRADCGMTVDATRALEPKVDVAHRSTSMPLAGSNPHGWEAPRDSSVVSYYGMERIYLCNECFVSALRPHISPCGIFLDALEPGD